VWKVTGDCLSEDASTFTVTERWPIHLEPPKFDELESKTEMAADRHQGGGPAEPRMYRAADRPVRSAASQTSSSRR